MEKFIQWLAWKMPKRLAYWAAIRIISYATTGPYGNTIVPELTVTEALKRWNTYPERPYNGRYNTHLVE